MAPSSASPGPPQDTPQDTPQGTPQDTPGRRAGGRGTADPREVARFDALAEGWWDPDGKFRPLHRLNPVRLEYVRGRAAARWRRDIRSLRPLEGLTVLDIGCGGGLLCEPLARLGATVTGIDAGETNVEIARCHAAAGGLAIAYRQALAEDLAAAEARFDIVLNMEVVEHVADVTTFLDACAALVAPGGMMVTATLNRTVKSFALAIVGAEYLLRWLPRGTHDWRRFIRPSELAGILRASGLRIVETTGVSFDPLHGRWQLSGDSDVNYMMLADRPQ
ncbi:MAG: bifunctional 2-polyprenyl-6-hydroxyphenol methylase/3-demethylubiquinol 3-O-methyltransferase UbiG [Alphaproteobacteria bacterium]